MSDDLAEVSVESGDRVLTGVGATEESLAKTMERHEAPAEPAAEPIPVKKSRGQERYAQLTSERDKERNAREAAERERDELRARLSAPPVHAPAPDDGARSASHQGSVPASGTGTESASRAGSTGSTPVKYPYNFDSYIAANPDADYDDYVTAKAVWTFQQSQPDLDTVVRQRIEADAASRTQADRESKEIDRGRQRYADFDAVLKGASHLWANNWPDHIVEAIGKMDEPEHARYALAKDPTLAEKIRTMNPILAGMEIAKLMPPSGAVALASTSSAGSVTPPAPYQPVGSGSKTTAPPLDELATRSGYDFDKSGYREKRAAERGVRRR